MQAVNELAPEPMESSSFDCGASKVLARILESLRQTVRDGAHDLSFHAMGTRCRISFAASDARMPELGLMALEWIAGFEAKYSRYLPDSLISRINASAGREPVALDPEAEQVFALCQEL
jgi:thiamine biosynthesis lipoprotein ApbE